MSVLGSDVETSSQQLTMEAPTRIILRGKRNKRSRPFTSGGDSDPYFSIPSSPQSYSTEEDEDMANCLMLLAQSGSTSSSREEYFYGGYECKTCNRSFNSFQALGGHRASHKKPNNLNKEDEEHIHLKKTSPAVMRQQQKAAKVHECSICGSEFSSGQALGGHMRRHRIPTTNNNTTTTISCCIIDHQKPRNHDDVQLDLNLPAPEDDHYYDSKFQFVFSTTPPLVDCHY